jgi:uncharacterized protein YecE (DUF72 family)
MSKIRIGTASWNDRTDLYPSWCRSPEEKLRFYSCEFPMVEVDGSFYAIPAQSTTAAWVKYTPDDFKFNVKAFRLFTCHQTDARFLPANARKELPSNLADGQELYYRDMPAKLRDLLWEEFEKALEPLHTAGKLGVVVFQFPPWFKPQSASLKHLQECRRRLPRFCTGVEFRNRRWFDGDNWYKTLGFLNHNGLIHIAVDGPQGLESSIPPEIGPGTNTCVVRFHGRNKDGWESNAKDERCNYLYSEDEMLGWAEKIRRIELQADQVHLVMNTNQGVENARLMGRLLGEGIMQKASLF